MLPPSLCAAQTSVLATTIPLILPSAIVFDPAGNLYLADTGNNIIRKVDTAGQITTIAGTGTQGFSGDSGPATAAQLDSPQGLAFDTASNLYLADTHNHVIRRLSLTTGVITTIAGSGSPGFSGDNGLATAAHLNLPTALALDAANNLYLADTSNHRIRRIDVTTHIITTVAGNGTQGFSGEGGPAIAASIDSPSGLALDASNNLYLADTHNHRIRKITSATGLITTIAGTNVQGFSGDNAPANTAALALPHGLSIDSSGNLYLADTENHRIRRIDAATGLITTVAGTGTQAFSGDNGPAIAAPLDTPRYTTLTPTTLLSLADTGNQRIRQLDSQPAPATLIHTIAGIGTITPGALILTAPSAIPYGTGSITATLGTSPPAAGLITFLATTNGATTTLGTVPLTANAAVLDTSGMPVGVYNIIATYAGDQSHTSAQSFILSFTIHSQQLKLSVSPITVFYGQPIPSISGTITGILSQDTANLTAAFTTSASTLSPVGTYSITAALTGPAAGNYSLSPSLSSVTILPAPTVTTLTDIIATATIAAPGKPVTFTSHVASTTTGTPTGTVTLFDGAASLLTAPVSASGDTTFTPAPASLAQGSHSFKAIYSGDPNFTASTSTPTLLAIGTNPTLPDFTLAATGAVSQNVISGSSTSFTFSVQSLGNLASPITLAATGLPNLATASFNPAYLPPGSAASTFTLTIATPNTTALQSHHNPAYALWSLLLLPIAGLTVRPRYGRIRIAFFVSSTLGLTLTLCSACGDRVYTGGTSASAAVKPYTITVTGTATTAANSVLQHSATVTLNLQPPG